MAGRTSPQQGTRDDVGAGAGAGAGGHRGDFSAGCSRAPPARLTQCRRPGTSRADLLGAGAKSGSPATAQVAVGEHAKVLGQFLIEHAVSRNGALTQESWVRFRRTVIRLDSCELITRPSGSPLLEGESYVLEKDEVREPAGGSA